MLKPDKTFHDVSFATLDQMIAEVGVFGALHGTPYKPGVPSHASEGARAVRGAMEWYSVARTHLDMDTQRPVMGEARVVDLGDIPGSLIDGATNRAAIGDVTAAVLEAGAIPLMLGGDDSTPIPFIEAFGAAPVWIVQVDAHLDWRDEVMDERLGYSSTMRRASEMAHVEGIVQIGIRGPGSARETDLAEARGWGAKIFTGRDVHAGGVGPALAAVPEGARVILTVDADGLDPSVCPGVLLPAFGGLSYQQMLDLIHGLGKRIAGAAFVEFVPSKDIGGLGAQAIARLAANVIAARF